TAVAILPCPLIIMIAVSGDMDLRRSSVSIPSIPGSQTSSSTQLYRRSSNAAIHSSPVATALTENPSSSSTAPSVALIPSSSSTTRTELGIRSVVSTLGHSSGREFHSDGRAGTEPVYVKAEHPTGIRENFELTATPPDKNDRSEDGSAKKSAHQQNSDNAE